jgi:hypothetical protein
VVDGLLAGSIDRMTIAVAAVVVGHQRERRAHDLEERPTIAVAPLEAGLGIRALLLGVVAAELCTVTREEVGRGASRARHHGAARWAR